MKKTYQLSVGFNLATKGNYPLVQHPEVNSWIGWGDKQLLVDESNQHQFTAPFELEDGEMEILSDLVINDITLKVDYASIYTIKTDTDQTALIGLNTLLNVSASDEDEAYKIATNLVKNENVKIEELTFRDELTDNIYTAQVLKFEVEVDSEYIREVEEDECA